MDVYRSFRWPLENQQSNETLVNPSSPTTYECPVAQRRITTSLEQLSKYSILENYNLILGDSVVYGMYDPRFYGLDGWVSVGQNSQTTQCLVSELEWFLNLKPKTILLYIGGNDADRGIPGEIICSNLENVSDKIIRTGTRLIISEIHGTLSKNRDPIIVATVNQCINNIGKNNNLMVLTSPKEFAFQTMEQAKVYSTDGEHFNDAGYSLWVKHIAKQLQSFK